MVAGTYNVTISVSWEEDNTKCEASKTIKVTTRGCVLVDWSSPVDAAKWTKALNNGEQVSRVVITDSELSGFKVTGKVRPLRYATAVDRDLSAELLRIENITSGLTNANLNFDSATGTASFKDVTTLTKKDSSKAASTRLTFSLENESGEPEVVKEIIIVINND